MILSKISHPNVISIIGKYRSKDYYDIVLDYCNGGTLKNYLKNHGPLKEIEARQIIK